MAKKVKLRKLEANGKPVKVDGQEVFIEVDPIAASNISKSKFWEIADDPSESKGSPKVSRKKKEDAPEETQDDVKSESNEE